MKKTLWMVMGLLAVTGLAGASAAASTDPISEEPPGDAPEGGPGLCASAEWKGQEVLRICVEGKAH